jgi:hypothetical protein
MFDVQNHLQKFDEIWFRGLCKIILDEFQFNLIPNLHEGHFEHVWFSQKLFIVQKIAT